MPVPDISYNFYANPPERGIVVEFRKNPEFAGLVIITYDSYTSVKEESFEIAALGSMNLTAEYNVEIQQDSATMLITVLFENVEVVSEYNPLTESLTVEDFHPFIHYGVILGSNGGSADVNLLEYQANSTEPLLNRFEPLYVLATNFSNSASEFSFDCNISSSGNIGISASSDLYIRREGEEFGGGWDSTFYSKGGAFPLNDLPYVLKPPIQNWHGSPEFLIDRALWEFRFKEYLGEFPSTATLYINNIEAQLEDLPSEWLGFTVDVEWVFSFGYNTLPSTGSDPYEFDLILEFRRTSDPDTIFEQPFHVRVEPPE
jgi:hypothetical protein